MADGQLLQFMHRVRRLLGGGAAPAAADSHLLDLFVRQHDTDAFTDLMQRHGPMVLGVCRRILGDAHEAEDVCQAAFLVLARKAASIRSEGCIAGWLCRVACRLALTTRASGARRRQLEQEAHRMSAPSAAPSSPELRLMLDEELNQLPAKYHAPLVLCYLEGKTYEEAASQLAWSHSTLKGRLTHGRELLRKRLARRGLALPAVAFAAALSEGTAPAALPASMIAATRDVALDFAAGQVKGGLPAIVLAEASLRAAVAFKRKVAAAALLVLLAGGVVLTAALPGAPPASTELTSPVAAPAKDGPAPLATQLGEKWFRFDRAYQDSLLTPDGKRLVGLSTRGLHIGDLATGKEVASWLFDTRNYRLAGISADGKTLAAWSHAGKAETIFWDLAAGKMGEPAAYPLPAHRHLKNAVLSPDGSRLAFVLETEEKQRIGHLVVACDRDRRELVRITGDPLLLDVFDLAFSPDGRNLAVAGCVDYDAKARRRIHALSVWEIATRKVRQELVREVESPRNRYATVAFARDGGRLAASRREKDSLQVWDLGTGKEVKPDPKNDMVKLAAEFPPAIRFIAWQEAAVKQGKPVEIKGGEEHYQPVALTSDGQSLLLQNVNRSPARLKLADPATGKESSVSSTPRGITALHFIGEGKAILAQRGTAPGQLWDLQSGKETPAVAGRDAAAVARSLAARQGSWFVHAGASGAPLGGPRKDFKQIGPDRYEKVEEAGKSPDKKYAIMATITHWNFMGAVPKGSVQYALVDAATGKTVIGKFNAPFAISPDSKVLLKQVSDQNPKPRLVWVEIASSKEIASLTTACLDICWSPDGKMAAALGADNEFFLIDLQTGKHQAIDGHADVSAAAFSPDSKHLASGSLDGTIRIWDVTEVAKKR